MAQTRPEIQTTERKAINDIFALSISRRSSYRPSSSGQTQRLPKIKSNLFSNPKFLTKDGNLPVSRIVSDGLLRSNSIRTLKFSAHGFKDENKLKWSGTSDIEDFKTPRQLPRMAKWVK
jgi:hypothetical protein